LPSSIRSICRHPMSANVTTPPGSHTLSLHDALPILLLPDLMAGCSLADSCPPEAFGKLVEAHPDHVVITYVNCSAEVKALSDIIDRKSTRLNSSHVKISYAVFCLKTKTT